MQISELKKGLSAIDRQTCIINYNYSCTKSVRNILASLCSFLTVTVLLSYSFDCYFLSNSTCYCSIYGLLQCVATLVFVTQSIHSLEVFGVELVVENKALLHRSSTSAVCQTRTHTQATYCKLQKFYITNKVNILRSMIEQHLLAVNNCFFLFGATVACSFDE